MSAKNNKSRGRNGEREIRELLLSYFPELEPDDVRLVGSGASGEDILLSPAARKLIPWQIEVKRRKNISVLRFMEQAEGHGEHTAIAFFREDRGKWYACIEAKHVLSLLQRAMK